jgi:YgiT-type zinc finger domain-containing protein
MECLCCRARMRRGTAPFVIDRNGYHVSWDNIPAWVCDQCGEVLFETREVELIQEALVGLDRETATLVSSLLG